MAKNLRPFLAAGGPLTFTARTFEKENINKIYFSSTHNKQTKNTVTNIQ